MNDIEFRNICEIFSFEIKEKITMFRNLSLNEQDQFLNKLSINTQKVILQLKEFQKNDLVDKSYRYDGKKKTW